MFRALRRLLRRNARRITLPARVRVSYGDHNDRFALALPRDATAERRLTLRHSTGDWYLLRFDEPFEYDGRQHQVALVRSRWEGHEIGDGTSTSVNLLLVRDQGLLEKPDAGIEDFEHIAWAQITTL